jgi:hypothetical protein
MRLTVTAGSELTGSRFSYRQDRDGRSSAALRYAAPCCLPAMPLFSPCSAEPRFDFKRLKYLWIIDIVGWFFGLKSKFFPESREAREVRERRSTGSLPRRGGRSVYDTSRLIGLKRSRFPSWFDSPPYPDRMPRA